MSEAIPNTPAQDKFNKAVEDAWEEEKTWPIYHVVLTGEPRVWAPRNDERYWQLEDPDDNNSRWIPRPEEELPEDAELVDGEVVRVARAEVSCHARSEDHAKMLALRDNPDYDTVELVEVRQ